MKLFTKKRVAIAVGLIVVAGSSYAWLAPKGEQVVPPPKYRFTAVDMGSINQTVTATGTINPVALVNVGSQVSGTVVELNVDFNDRVTKGQVLLKLDPTIFNAQVRQAQASLASAQASQRLAQANFQRNEQLVSRSFVSSVALDQTRRELDVARANIQLAQAQLERAQADLNNSVIRSPIDGVIIKRTIDLGQTVAASFTTPNLFQIARDLTKMQIDTSVSEADVGALKDGLPARFVVDAYPDREFHATMRQFRLAANVVQNVVTYNVVLDVDNKDEMLKPGMTAQVRLVVANRANVMRIPTTALRFTLPEEELEKQKKLEKENNKGAARTAALAPASAPDDDLAFRSPNETARMFKVYRLDAKNQPQPVDIRAGLSNFRYTEVVGGSLKTGDRIVTRSLVQQQEDDL